MRVPCAVVAPRPTYFSTLELGVGAWCWSCFRIGRWTGVRPCVVYSLCLRPGPRGSRACCCWVLALGMRYMDIFFCAFFWKCMWRNLRGGRGSP